MGIELAKAYVAITADASGVPRGVGSGLSNAESMVSGFAGRINGILGTIGVGFGLYKLVESSREWIAAAQEDIDAGQRVAATIRATGGAAGFTAGQLREYASEMQAAGIYGDEMILGGMSKMLTFKSVAGDVFKSAMSVAADMAASGFGSVESSAVMLGRALEEPILGLTMMRRVGISFNEQQKETIKALMAQNKQHEAQALILEVVAGQMGGVNKAMAETPSGQLKQLRNTLGDLKEEMGKLVIPIEQFKLKVQIEFYKAMLKIGELVSGLSKTLDSLGVSWDRVAKFIGRFSAELVAFGTVAIGTIAVVKSLTLATAMLQAMSGPKGWISFGVGVAVATVGYGMLSKVMDEVAKSAKDAQDAMGKAKLPGAAGGISPEDAGKQSEAIEKAMEDVRKLRSELFLLGLGVPKELASSIADVDAQVREFSKTVGGNEEMIGRFRKALLEAVTVKANIEMAGKFEDLRLQIQATINQLNDYDKAIIAMMGRKDVGSADKLRFVQLQRDLQRANTGEEIRKIQEETRHLRDRMSEASVKIEEFNAANRGIGMSGARERFAAAVKEQQKVKIELETGKVNDQLEQLEKNASKSAIAIRDFKRQFSAKELVEFAPQIARFEAAMKKLEWKENEKQIKDVNDQIMFLKKGWSEVTIAAYKFAQQPGVDQGQVNRFHAAQVELRKFQEAKDLTGRFGFPDLGRKVQDIMLKQGKDEVPQILRQQLDLQREQFDWQKEQKLVGPGEGYARLAK